MTPRRRLSLERRPTARAVVHLFVDALREHGILIDAFRRELMLDDGSDDRRRAESGTDAGEPVVCFDADQRCITLDLGSEVGAVALFLRNGCGHWNRGHFDDFHGSLFPVSRSHLDFGWRSRSIAECHKPRYFVAGNLVFAGARLENRPKSSIPYIFFSFSPVGCPLRIQACDSNSSKVCRGSQLRRCRSTCILARNGTSGWAPIPTIARVSSAINASRCSAVKGKRSA